MEPINDGFMMLLDEFSLGGVVLGCISSDGVDWAGDKPTVTTLNAAQKRSGPVKRIISAPGSDELTYQMIEMVAEKIKTVAGGTFTGETYFAPDTKVMLEGAAQIKTGTGQTISIPKSSTMAVVRGKLGTTGNLYCDCTTTFLAPLDGSKPYSIGPTIPAVTTEFDALSFAAAGESKLIRISASGAVQITGLPTGYTMAQEGNYLMITAPANSTQIAVAATLTIALASDANTKATIAIAQPHE